MGGRPPPAQSIGLGLVSHADCSLCHGWLEFISSNCSKQVRGRKPHFGGWEPDSEKKFKRLKTQLRELKKKSHEASECSMFLLDSFFMAMKPYGLRALHTWCFGVRTPHTEKLTGGGVTVPRTLCRAAQTEELIENAPKVTCMLRSWKKRSLARK